ncbi:MAG: hypothetical protein IPK29_15490 [Betaproteobacteria bacterium]|jgi:hypothetical protein|nr:hypothetical protein [Betaproteobacteria bacterium]
MSRLRRAALPGLLLAALALPAQAHRPTVQECREAGEFIRNAALSRDNGLSREAFMDRLLGDLMAIRGHPPAMRWFAQDAESEAFLVAAAGQVFDRPRRASEHEAETLRACLARMGAGAT